MPKLFPAPGPHLMRRLADLPAEYLAPPTSDDSITARELTYCHNQAVKTYGSDSGGYHAFDPAERFTAGVFDGQGGFPRGSVVTDLAWGRITWAVAQRILEHDGHA